MNSRLSLCHTFTFNNPIDSINDPIHQLVSNYEEILKVSENENKKMMKFLYFNKKKIHDILYDQEELYNISSTSNEKVFFSELFYLSLLVLDTPETINYTYKLNYIKNINSQFNRDKESKSIKKILYAKIILSLIFNFKGEDEYDEEEFGEEIEKMENESKNIINNNLDVFNEMNINIDEKEIYHNKIDWLYVEIIGALIKHNKFNDYKYIIDIIEQLGLEHINITNYIFEGLKRILDSNENYVKIYSLNNISDLLNENKINFYYLLIKYILKNSYFIYNIDFLLTNIKKFIKYIKKISEERNSLITTNDILHNDNNNKKIIEILELLSIKYYFNIFTTFHEKFKNSNQCYSKSISKICSLERKINGDEKEFYDKNKNLEINSSNTDEENDYNAFLDKIEYNKAKEILNKLYLKINIFPMENNQNKYIFKEIKYGQNEIPIKKNELKLYADYDTITEKDKENQDGEILYKNYKRLVNFIQEIEDYIKHSEIKFNPQIILELDKKDHIINEEHVSNEFKDLYNITCKSTFINQLENDREMTFKDENILVHSINGKSQGFINLINELINDDYTDEKFIYNE